MSATAFGEALRLGEALGWVCLPLLKRPDGRWVPPHGYAHLMDERFSLALAEKLWDGHQDAEGIGALWPADVVEVEADTDDGTEWIRRRKPPRTPSFGSRRGPHYLFRATGARASTRPHPGVEVLSREGGKRLLLLPPTPPKAWMPSLSPYEVELVPLPPSFAVRVSGNGHKKRTPLLIPELIPKGQREEMLVSLAGSMRKRGADEAAIRAALLATLPRVEQPPGQTLTETDVARIAHSASKWEPGSGPTTSVPGGEQAAESAPLEGIFEGGTFVPPSLGRAAEKTGHLRKGPGRSLWRYADGVYRDDGEEWLAGFVRDQLGDRFRDNRLREVRAWCFANSSAKLPTQPATNYVNAANAIVYWLESPLRLQAHSPDVPSIMQIPAVWNPEADCPEIRKFLDRVLPETDRTACMVFLFEWIGYLLVASSKMQRALMLLGPGDTGKSTLLKLIEWFLGGANVSHHSLQAICDDKFTAADLYGRVANICADLDAKSLGHSGKFKMVVSGDTISAEKKFKDPFKYQPFARLMFSANEAPGTADQSDAYYKRWLVLPMTRKLGMEEQDPDLLERMTTPAELSGLLKYAVGGLRQLWARGRFDEPAVMREAAHRYRLDTDTVVGYVEACCELDHDGRERMGGLYRDYRDWCSKNNRRELGLQRFREHLIGTYAALSVRTLDGYPTLHGIKLKGRED